MNDDRNRLTANLNSICDDYVLARAILSLLTKQEFSDWYEGEFEEWLHDGGDETGVLDWLDGRVHKRVVNQINVKVNTCPTCGLVNQHDEGCDEPISSNFPEVQ